MEMVCVTRACTPPSEREGVRESSSCRIAGLLLLCVCVCVCERERVHECGCGRGCGQKDT